MSSPTSFIICGHLSSRLTLCMQVIERARLHNLKSTWRHAFISHTYYAENVFGSED
jgi:hypothetical protein